MTTATRGAASTRSPKTTAQPTAQASARPVAAGPTDRPTTSATTAAATSTPPGAATVEAETSALLGAALRLLPRACLEPVLRTGCPWFAQLPPAAGRQCLAEFDAARRTDDAERSVADVLDRWRASAAAFTG
ncbi:hypothetical protein BJY21_003032 [Kineosphaera limosa]|uniref:Uncharacterized protein n=1 Tax=Kineosphaera limosa NBRC 100340 TaxID=1184609 RepID=K6WSC6_9MICO|nr:hypothetical protein [Kineosphaera limosa]NYE01848.1 hypothetical protein [Kineosphaera limosa]GAB96751.1 hypothetical protein KILIM_047_00130 [Kineosphaera limosa NBRC 100340]